MTNQYRSCNTSNAARYRSDCIYDRLNFCEIYVSAKFSFCVYVDTNIDDCLSSRYISIVYNTGTACSYDYDISFSYNRWHIYGSCVADGNSCIFLNQHHSSRFTNYKASSDNNCFFTCTVNSIMIQNFHTCLWSTWRESDRFSCKYTRHRAICHTVYVFCRIQSVLNQRLIQMFWKRTE